MYQIVSVKVKCLSDSSAVTAVVAMHQIGCARDARMPRCRLDSLQSDNNLFCLDANTLYRRHVETFPTKIPERQLRRQVEYYEYCI